MFLLYFVSLTFTCNTHVRLADFVDVNTACFMSTSFEKFSRISFLTDKSEANFVAYKPFFVIEKQLTGFYNESCLCTTIISLEDNDTGNLETAILI